MDSTKIFHNIDPVYDENSESLILGTMPSPKSRETGFYYGHPKNKFWPVMAAVFEEEKIPETIEEKKVFLIKNHIALWDVLRSCQISGASDQSIKDPVPNDIAGLVSKTKIKKIFTTGKKAGELYRRFCMEATGIKNIGLPSTSPANCRFSIEKLVNEYIIIRERSGDFLSEVFYL